MTWGDVLGGLLGGGLALAGLIGGTITIGLAARRRGRRQRGA